MKCRITPEEYVDEYLKTERPASLTQDILDSNAVPRLKGYTARPGKVSDVIYGGKGSYFDKKEGREVEFENHPLNTPNGIPLILMVRTRRISTHDINRGEIPFKDQILARNHNYMRRMLADAIGTSQFDVPGLDDQSVVIAAEKLQQFGFENVLRAYMAKSTTSTSLYVHYMKGEREFCGHKLPEGLFPNGPLPYIMDTPSTKSDEHDESLSSEEMFRRRICTPDQYMQIRNGSLFGFGKVDQYFRPRGIIPVDTKTEHGISIDGKIKSQDEIWTMDSSRFWPLDDYNTQMGLFLTSNEEELVAYLKHTQPGIKEKDYIANGKVVPSPRSLSKEFARGFSEGERGYTDEQRRAIAIRYIEGIEDLLGQPFVPDLRPRDERVISGLEAAVKLAD